MMFLSPTDELPPTIPPLANLLMDDKAARTAPTLAAIATRFAGKGSFAPLLVAPAIDDWASALASNLPATALVSFAAVSFFTADVSPAFKAVMVESNPICSE